MSSSDREKWDAIYRGRGETGRGHAELLTRIAPLLPVQGRALDLAGGGGRNALFLASRDLDVTVVDVSSEGLSLAKRRASTRGLALETAVIDLDSDLDVFLRDFAPSPNRHANSTDNANDARAGGWNVVLNFHYLNRALISRIDELLAPSGVFVFCQPTRENLERHSKPSERFLLEPEELRTLMPTGLDVLHFAEDWSPEGRHEAELVASRSA